MSSYIYMSLLFHFNFFYRYCHLQGQWFQWFHARGSVWQSRPRWTVEYSYCRLCWKWTQGRVRLLFVVLLKRRNGWLGKLPAFHNKITPNQVTKWCLYVCLLQSDNSKWCHNTTREYVLRARVLLPLSIGSDNCGISYELVVPLEFNS